MVTTRLVGWSALVWCVAQSGLLFGQEAVLPHGDPRLQATEEESARRDDVRDGRLKQQGQGLNYRIAGEAGPSASMGESAGGAGNAPTGQDTGLADPSVNPGQASGMHSVQGRIIKSDGDTHIVRQLSGPDATLMVDARTAGDKDLHPGDVITGLVSPQGRAVVVHKEQR